MADDGSDKFRKLPDLPIRMYVAAILDGDPEISSLYESVRDQRSLFTPVVPEQTQRPQRPEPSEVKRKGKEIVVCEEPIEHQHSDERDISSQIDADDDDDDDDMSRTIPISQIKEKKKVSLSKIIKNIQSSENKSNKSLIPKVTPGKRDVSKPRRTTNVEDDDDDFTLKSSRKRKASKVDRNMNPKDANVKNPRLDEVNTPKVNTDKRKQKMVPADEPRSGVAKPLIREYSCDDIERLFAARNAAKGVGSSSVFDRVGNLEKNKTVQVEDLQDHAGTQLSGAAKELKVLCLSNGEVRKANKLVFSGMVHGSGPSGSKVVQPGEAIKKNCV
ncbi:uncharacterized protein [Rutidosis leptorrhynchoides]|uniref:uncharacterized protein isoform X2 n=1 Tax=Rutidosis leptorrhynchoides TaxID=125765 RepID=UPI003A99B214